MTVISLTEWWVSTSLFNHWFSELES